MSDVQWRGRRNRGAELLWKGTRCVKCARLIERDAPYLVRREFIAFSYYCEACGTVKRTNDSPAPERTPEGE